MFSIFRFALAHKLSCRCVPLAHQSRHLHPQPSRLQPHNSFSLVSPFEYEVALGWLPENKLLGEQDPAKLFTRVGILTEQYAQLSCSNRFATTLTPVRGLLQTHLHFKVQLVILWQKCLSLMLTLIVWTHFYYLANTRKRNEKLDNVCFSLMKRTHIDIGYQGLNITAHLSSSPPQWVSI